MEGVRIEMKKSTVVLAVIASVALVGVVGAGSANAQTISQAPSATPQPWGALGMQHMRGYGSDGEGPLHDYLIAAFADALGISPSDLEARLDGGETLSAIAQDEGFSLDEFRTLFSEARQTALENAQADGVVTQAQTQSMLRLMNGTGPLGECPMWGDGDEVGGRLGGVGMFGNRGGRGGFQGQ